MSKLFKCFPRFFLKIISTQFKYPKSAVQPYRPEVCMPVTIEDVLALLPEMFPGKQPLPRKNLRRNPDNPGKPTEQEIKDQADDMAQRGLQNPIQVGPDKANPLAGGAQLHPDDPRLRADGKPWELGDFNYLIYGGELRDRAAELLQWETIDGFIHNPTPEEAADLLYWDNKVRKRGWWADYLYIELKIKSNPDITQRQIADKWKIDEVKVNRAIRLLPLLNPESRALIASVASNSSTLKPSIASNASNSNRKKWEFSDRAAFQLAGLGPGTGLKPGVKKKMVIPAPDTPIEPGQASHGPRLEASAQLAPQKLWPYPPIPPETQDLVLRALKVAIDHKMTEAKVKALVQAVLAGTPPEEYEKQKTHTTIPAQGGLHKFLTAVAGHLTKASSALGTAKTQGKPKSGSKGGGKGKTASKAKASKSLWWKSLAWVWHKLIGAIEWLVKWPYRMLEKGIRLCAEGKWVNGLIQLGFTALVLWAILWAWRHPGRVVGWVEGEAERVYDSATGWEQAKTSGSPPSPKAILTPAASSILAAVAPAQPRQHQKIRKSAAAPNQGPPPVVPAQAAPTLSIPVQYQSRIPSEKMFVQDFAGYFFGATYRDTPVWLGYLKNEVWENYSEKFFYDFFPPSYLQKVQDEKLNVFFKATKPAECVKADYFEDDFRVEGALTVQSDLHYPGEVVATQPVAIIFGVYPGPPPRVSKVEKIHVQ